MSECKIISVASRKGGVGKSTATRNLGYYLAEWGKRVLLVDINSQGNLSTGFDELKIATVGGTIVEPMWVVMRMNSCPQLKHLLSIVDNLIIFPTSFTMLTIALHIDGD